MSERSKHAQNAVISAPPASEFEGSRSARVTKLKWWLRVVGAIYVLNGIMMAVVRAPIRSAGPDGVLDAAAAGDPTARFLVDTWVGFGIEVAAIGVVLLVASATPGLAKVLVWLVIGIELTRGIAFDVYMVARDYEPSVFVPWLVVHAVIIVTGVLVLRDLYEGETNVPERSRVV
jgi:hypothetical protein